MAQPRKAPARRATTPRPAGNKRVTWKRKPAGLFSKALMQAVDTMPAGTPDRALVLEALRTIPPEKVKDALREAGPREHALLFTVLPADQIAPVLHSLPPELLAPPELPPPELPAPTGGPPAEILTTTYVNEPFVSAAGDPAWNKHLTDGVTVRDYSPFGPNFYEWSTVYDRGLEFEREGGLENPLVGLTGWVIASANKGGLSGGDVWFTHPFGFDWEYYIAPDPQYESLLAPDSANTGVDPTKSRDDPSYVTDWDYYNANGAARDIGLDPQLGLLGVEMDQGLVPPQFRNGVTTGTRIATFGRWIVDSGHPDFHTEIHPPLVMATAAVVPPPRGSRGVSEATHVELMSRPFSVSQKFEEGNFVQHLIAEVGKVETTIFGFPESWRVEAHPHVYQVPYVGRPYIKLLVKPPVPRSTRVTAQQQLMVNFHFTARTGVAVRVFDAGDDTVGIIIVLGDVGPAQLPTKNDWNIDWGQTDFSWIVDILSALDLLFDPFGIWVLNRGILTDLYDAPVAASSNDTQNIAGPVALGALPPLAGYSTGDDQPFPIYGWLDVYWATSSVVVEGPVAAEEAS